ncbi:hypothetical protein HPP92_010553 [Vanilla planifolia]|uniref:Rab-GAP TBC domain-containing protein n=1 Tax=Vanilla planifolia TaxID=51239 RepID=A0A835V168_VANPL|nr:hypothetical protein HPP92_010793 [Vanilla planifolia]KAG0482469.1 hypothetical protein HPP92_010553 [Vanilla planifolia]
MIAAPVQRPSPDPSPPGRISGGGLRFSNLRGVQWRIHLGTLPSSPSASIEDLRRIAADSRRSYASLRRHLRMKDGTRSPDLALDNPLSQDPESPWGRFFRSAELEKMVDQDLTRLYLEDESYFQTPACLAMLRRILILWCLRHPECGYRQGMHELLAPLLYVLHIDLNYLSEARRLYEDYFNNEFDGLSCPEINLVSSHKTKKAKSWDLGGCGDDFFLGNETSIACLDGLDPSLRDVFLLNDAYGVEGELGVVISERFMEHDAYNMFDGLMGGNHGNVAMADFFSSAPATGSSMGISPVIEASSALFDLLMTVDYSLHSHLVELGIEPQYFALRWLRVLFGREFSFNNLLIIWDELFSWTNDSFVENEDHSFKVLCSPRGAFISAMAVSMLLLVRSSLLATENATSCLQRLLNFPRNIDVMKLIEKARSLHTLSCETNLLASPLAISKQNRPSVASRIPSSVTPTTPVKILTDSYWEERWQVLQKEEAFQKNDLNKGGKIKEYFGKKLGLLRAESDPFLAKNVSEKKQSRSSVRRRLLDDFSKDPEYDGKAVEHSLLSKESPPDKNASNCFLKEQADLSSMSTSECMITESCISPESSALSVVTIPTPSEYDPEIGSESGFSIGNIEDNNYAEESKSDSGNLVPNETEHVAAKSGTNDVEIRGIPELKERKSRSGKFQWFWKFGRGSVEGCSEKGGSAKTQRSNSFTKGNFIKESIESSPSDFNSGADNTRIEAGEKKVMNTLKNIGQSMLENIQVIESVFQQEKGQTTAVAALTELRKISNFLSEL